MSSPSDAELDLSFRQNQANHKRLNRAIQCFGKAQNHLRQQSDHLRAARKAKTEKTREKRYEDAIVAADRAAAKFHEGYGALMDPDLPGVDAEELGRRETGSRSVMTAKGMHLAGRLDQEGRAQQHEDRAASRNVSLASVFGDMTKRVNPLEVMQGMADAGWDSARIGRLAASMLELAENAKTLSKKQTALRMVMELWKFTEPKAVIDMERPLEDMDEEETQGLIQALAKELGLQ